LKTYHLATLVSDACFLNILLNDFAWYPCTGANDSNLVCFVQILVLSVKIYLESSSRKLNDGLPNKRKRLYVCT
jgi:hypothetical protein